MDRWYMTLLTQTTFLKCSLTNSNNHQKMTFLYILQAITRGQRTPKGMDWGLFESHISKLKSLRFYFSLESLPKLGSARALISFHILTPEKVSHLMHSKQLYLETDSNASPHKSTHYPRFSSLTVSSWLISLLLGLLISSTGLSSSSIPSSRYV